MTDKTGGTAFPVTYADTPAHHQGMTLRDWFAGQALAAIVSKLELHGRNSETGIPHKNVDAHECQIIKNEVARGAYGYADAMIAARMSDADLWESFK